MIRTNFITKGNVIQQLLSDELIVQSYVYSEKSSKYWKIQNAITVELSNGKIINIPNGFVYNMTIIPKWLWSIIRPFNDGLFAYLLHNVLYVNKSHGMSRKDVDKEMLFWSNIINKNKFDNKLRYYIIRIIGWLWWYRIIKTKHNIV